jgi:diguanylate cyclase (GGDEF)-like protein
MNQSHSPELIQPLDSLVRNTQDLSRSYAMLSSLTTIESIVVETLTENHPDDATENDTQLQRIDLAMHTEVEVMRQLVPLALANNNRFLSHEVAALREDLKVSKTTIDTLTRVARLLGEELQANDQIIKWLGTMAIFDSLTGILNRNGFKLVLEALHSVSETENKSYGVIFIDLNNFKLVNDLFGHETGDEVLKRTGKVLSETTRQDVDAPFDIRRSDIIARARQTTEEEHAYDSETARLGGDEYVVLIALDDISNHESNEQNAITTLERIKSNLSDEFSEDNRLLGVGFGFSMGIGIYKAGMTSDQVVEEADKNMYRDKRNDRRPRPI